MKKTRNILLLEDFSDSAKGVIDKLSEVTACQLNVDWVTNCDLAYKKLARKHNYDLLITDMQINSENEHYDIETGEDLIVKLKKLTNYPKIVVYSMVDQPAVLDLLVNNLEVDGYIIKGRRSLEELVSSLPLIFLDSTYYSKKVKTTLHKWQNTLQTSRLDRAILRFLYQGYKINQLPELLSKKGYKSTSQATIENSIRDLKDYFNAKTTMQLVAIAKDKKAFVV